ALTHEQLGMFNYFDSLATDRAYNSWDDWYIDGYLIGYREYVTAFLTYLTSTLFESTPGYRTSLYQDLAHTLIKRMNTTMAEYGNDSMEYWEWGRTSYPDYYFPDPSDPSGVYTGGFRGPANIMWTGHYALMLALYERSFNTGTMTDELTWYMSDWNNSLTTDGKGNPQEGGIWKVGLIPCEPQFVFVNCNSIPIYATELFDNMFGTNYMPIWDYGLNWLNNVMQDDYGLFSYMTVVSPTLGATEEPDVTYPYVSSDDLGITVSGYGTSWALTFLEYTQENETIHDYPVFLEAYGRDVSSDQMYITSSYKYPQTFGDINGMLASLFTLALANQRGDPRTVERLLNFWLSSSNAVWSSDGRTLHYEDGMASVIRALEVVLPMAEVWGTSPTTMRDLADARPTEFWDYPYISAADDDKIWVYQAEWDHHKEAFILNIEIDQTATLSFSNFDSVPSAYASGLVLEELTALGDDYTLTLSPGTYNIVIM
ncbi:MAG: linalool dehydratase/isomerase domain-containing protein, partial [Candidatus Thorarchaeota archaeon]